MYFGNKQYKVKEGKEALVKPLLGINKVKII